jgi:hypothetical protein
MDGELKQRILDYAQKAYFAAYQKSLRETEIELVNAKERFNLMGALLSSDMVREAARIEAEHIRRCVLAKTNALLDAYELNGVEIDGFIKIQANEVRWELVQAIGRDPNVLNPRTPDRGNLAHFLATFTSGIVEEAECEIEQRKVVPKMRKPQPPIQNIYHLIGNNSRVNVHSTDQSVNIVNVTNQELFVEMRKAISDGVAREERGRILEKLDALEKAQNTPTFGQRYAHFVAVAADYMTLLGPFMPALAELLAK